MEPRPDGTAVGSTPTTPSITASASAYGGVGLGSLRDVSLGERRQLCAVHSASAVSPYRYNNGRMSDVRFVSPVPVPGVPGSLTGDLVLVDSFPVPAIDHAVDVPGPGYYSGPFSSLDYRFLVGRDASFR